MRHVYSEKINNILKDAFKEENHLENFAYPTGYTIMNYADIIITFYVTNGRRDLFHKTASGCEYRVDSQYLSLFKQYAPAKFLRKDYLKDIKDANGNTPYWIFKFEYEGNSYRALLRELIELNDETLSDTQKQQLGHNYAELQCKDKYYTIIKVVPDNEEQMWVTNTRMWKPDIVHTEFIDYVPEIEGFQPNSTVDL